MPPKSRKRWTAEEDKELRRRIHLNQPQFSIAQALGRTFSAVGSRAQQLGIKMPAPLRPRRSE